MVSSYCHFGDIGMGSVFSFAQDCYLMQWHNPNRDFCLSLGNCLLGTPCIFTIQGFVWGWRDELLAIAVRTHRRCLVLCAPEHCSQTHPLSDVVIVIAVNPLLTTILAAIFLKEEHFSWKILLKFDGGICRCSSGDISGRICVGKWPAGQLARFSGGSLLGGLLCDSQASARQAQHTLDNSQGDVLWHRCALCL